MVSLPSIFHQGMLQSVQRIPAIGALNSWDRHPAHDIVLRYTDSIVVPETFHTGPNRRLEHA